MKIKKWMKKKSATVVTGAAVAGIAAGALANASVLENLFEPGKFQKFENQDPGEDYDYISGDGANLDLADSNNQGDNTGGQDGQQFLQKTDTWSQLQSDDTGTASGLGLANMDRGSATGNINGNAIQFTDDPSNTAIKTGMSDGIIKTGTQGTASAATDNSQENGDNGPGSILKPDADNKAEENPEENNKKDDKKNENNGQNEKPSKPQQPEKKWEDTQLDPSDPVITEHGELQNITARITRSYYVLREEFQASDAEVTAVFLTENGEKKEIPLTYGGEDGYRVFLPTSKVGNQMATFTYAGMSVQVPYYVSENYVSIYYHAAYAGDDSSYYMATFPGVPLKGQEGYEDVARQVQAPYNYAGTDDLVDLTKVHGKMIAYLGDPKIKSSFVAYSVENYKDVVFLEEKDGYLTNMLSGFGYVYNKKMQDDRTYLYYPVKNWEEGQRNVIDIVVPVPSGYKIRREVTDAEDMKQCTGEQVLEGYEGKESTLTVPMGVTKIALKTPADQVTRLELPQSVQSIDFASIARELPNLEEYVVTDGSDSYKDYLVENGVVYSADGKTLLSVPAGKTSFTVPERVTGLEAGCFAGMSEEAVISFAGDTIPKVNGDTGYRGTVRLPDSQGDLVRKAYMFAFGTECQQIRFVTDTHQSNDYIYDEKGPILRSKEDSSVLMGVPAQTRGYYKTDDSITAIGSYAFAACKNLTDIELGEHVTQLKEESLILPDELESIKLDAGSANISSRAFGDGACPEQLRIYVGEEDYPFYIYTWTKTLDPVYGDGTAERLLQMEHASYVYENGAKYQQLEGADGTVSYRLIRVYETDQVTFSVKEGTTQILAGALDRCEAMEILNLPETLEEVPSGLLKNCTALETITCQSGRTSLQNAGVPAGARVFAKGKDYQGFLVEKNCVYGENISGGYTLLNVTSNASGEFSVRADTTEVYQSAFAGCKSITALWAEDTESLRTIGAQAFRNSGIVGIMDLSKFTNLQTIGENAFAECGTMSELILPDQLENIPARMCYECKMLVDVKANGVKKIDKEAFWGCSVLRNLEGFDLVAELGDRAFYGCSSLHSVILPETLTVMGESCFANCTSLGKVELHGGLTGISRYCFYGCSSLTDIQFSEQSKKTIQVIGVQAFGGCGQLESLDLTGMSQLIQMGERTFSSCNSLTTVRLPENLKKIPDYCMEDCENLSIVQISGTTVPDLGDKIFGETPSSFVHLWIDENQVENCRDSYREALDQSYGAGTTDAIIGKIDEKIEYVRGVEFERTQEGRILKKASATLSGNYVIPEDVIEIADDAFRDCQELTRIEIPVAATLRLGDRCFKGCQGLQTVQIDGNITQWGEETFMDCTGISKLLIGNANIVSVKQIAKLGDRAFMNCTGLRTSGCVEIRSIIVIWGKECFSGCTNLKDISMSDNGRRSTTEIQDRAFYGCKNLNAFLTSKFSSLKVIGAYAFSECDTLKQPAIPASVTSIGEGCFMNCDNVTYVSFYGALEEYPRYCFKNCPKLIRTGGTALAFSSLKRIGESAYEGCTSLVNSTSWNLGRYSSLEEIGDRAFAGCSSLGDTILQATIRKIGCDSFAGCSQMHTLTIHAVTPPEIGGWSRDQLAADLRILVPDSKEDSDSIYLAYLEKLKASVGESDAYKILDSISDGAMDRNTPQKAVEVLPGEDGKAGNAEEGVEGDGKTGNAEEGSEGDASSQVPEEQQEEHQTGAGEDAGTAENPEQAGKTESTDTAGSMEHAENTENTENVQQTKQTIIGDE